MSPQLARTVVYRHPCDCDTASRPLLPGEKAEHRFDVDGEPFPWLITEDGATFTRHPAGEVLVGVTILVLDRERGQTDPLVDTFTHRPGAPAVIAGREFPWSITGPIAYRYDHGDGVAFLSLTFVAEHVDTDGEIVEMDET